VENVGAPTKFSIVAIPSIAGHGCHHSLNC